MNGLAKMLAEQALRNDQYVLDQWYWRAMKKDQSSAHSAERGHGLVDEGSGLGEVKGGTHSSLHFGHEYSSLQGRDSETLSAYLRAVSR